MKMLIEIKEIVTVDPIKNSHHTNYMFYDFEVLFKESNKYKQNRIHGVLILLNPLPTSGFYHPLGLTPTIAQFRSPLPSPPLARRCRSMKRSDLSGC